MITDRLLTVVLGQLDDVKAEDIKVIDVHKKTDITDYMVIATGKSQRHVKSLAEHVVEEVKKHDFRPLGMEGQDSGEWVLVDLGDVVVHIMQAQTRAFYQLEKLWEADYSVANASQL